MTPPTRAAAALILALSAVLAVPACGRTEPDAATSHRMDGSSTAGPAGLATAASTPQRPTVVAEAPAAPDAGGWQTIGFSVQGRPIRARSIGHGPRTVLFIGGIHGDEPEGTHTTAELPAAFIAAGLADAVTLTIVEDGNPDGRAADTRGNANGVDINRNFPASNFDETEPSNGGLPLSQPESRVLLDTIEHHNPDLIIVAHSWSGRRFINFDGPALGIAERFALTSGMPVEESSSFAPTPGSMGSYFGRDRGTSILSVEVLKGSDSIAVWNQLKLALLEAIAL